MVSTTDEVISETPVAVELNNEIAQITLATDLFKFFCLF